MKITYFTFGEKRELTKVWHLMVDIVRAPAFFLEYLMIKTVHEHTTILFFKVDIIS